MDKNSASEDIDSGIPGMNSMNFCPPPPRGMKQIIHTHPKSPQFDAGERERERERAQTQRRSGTARGEDCGSLVGPALTFELALPLAPPRARRFGHTRFSHITETLVKAVTPQVTMPLWWFYSVLLVVSPGCVRRHGC